MTNIGQGPDEPMLRGLVEELGIAGRVIFAGYQVDTTPYFDLLDIFVRVPASEAFELILSKRCLPGSR